MLYHNLLWKKLSHFVFFYLKNPGGNYGPVCLIIWSPLPYVFKIRGCTNTLHSAPYSFHNYINLSSYFVLYIAFESRYNKAFLCFGLAPIFFTLYLFACLILLSFVYPQKFQKQKREREREGEKGTNEGAIRTYVHSYCNDYILTAQGTCPSPINLCCRGS